MRMPAQKGGDLAMERSTVNLLIGFALVVTKQWNKTSVVVVVPFRKIL